MCSGIQHIAPLVLHAHQEWAVIKKTQPSKKPAWKALVLYRFMFAVVFGTKLLSEAYT